MQGSLNTSTSKCSVEVCSNASWARGWCPKHYYCWKRNGTPDGYVREMHGKFNTVEYKAWAAMKRRCNNPKTKDYKYWGGRGIKVCKRWDKFTNFLEDMGLKPSPNHTLDRINGDGDYSPDNCRWATKTEQASNRKAWGSYAK